MGLSGNGLPNIQTTSNCLPSSYKLTLCRKTRNPVPLKKMAPPPTHPKPQTQPPQPQTHQPPHPNKSKTPSIVPKNQPGNPTTPAPPTTSTHTATYPPAPPPHKNPPS